MSAEVLLVRHGETGWNAEGRVQGQADAPLSAVGRAQAEALGAALAGGALGAITGAASSDLARASDTCTTLEGALGLTPGPRLPGLRERHLGVLQGLTWAEARQKQPDAWRAARSERDARIPGGGESFRDLICRMKGTLETLSAERPGGRVAVVTHGGAILAAYALADQTRRKVPGNASVSVFQIDPSKGRWKFKGYHGKLAGGGSGGTTSGGDVL